MQVNASRLHLCWLFSSGFPPVVAPVLGIGAIEANGRGVGRHNATGLGLHSDASWRSCGCANRNAIPGGF